MPSFVPDDNASILVEFDASTSATSPPETSNQAINNAMNTMRLMAQRVSETMNSLSDRPSQVEVSFGLQLAADGSAAIVNIGRSAALSVKLTWNPPPPTPPESAIELYRGRDRLIDELSGTLSRPPKPWGDPAYDNYEDEAVWQEEDGPQWEAEENTEEDWGEEEYGYDDYDDYDEPPPNRRGRYDDWS